MTLLVFLKAVYDLGFYFTVAGIAASALGARTITLLIGIVGCAAVFTLSYPLRKRGALRFLPVLGYAFLMLLPLTKRPLILFLPIPVYHLTLIARGRYLPTWDQQAGQFKPYCVGSALLLLAAAVVTSVGEPARTIAVMALITVTCSVLLTRALRHDPEVCAQPAFQLLNGSLLAGVLLGAVFFSSDLFLSGMRAVITFVYDRIICPILLLICQIIGYAVYLLFRLLPIDMRGEMPDMSGLTNNFLTEETEAAGTAAEQSHPALKVLLILIAAAAVGFVLYRLFVYLSRDTGSGREIPAEQSYERKDLPAEKRPRAGLFGGTPAERVRRQYRAYLKLCRADGMKIAPSDTSQNVLDRSRRHADPEEELRGLYLRARYAGEADKKDADRAAELVREIKKAQ